MSTSPSTNPLVLPVAEGIRFIGDMSFDAIGTIEPDGVLGTLCCCLDQKTISIASGATVLING